MAQRRNKKATSFRLTPRALEKLSYIATIMGLSQADVIELAIHSLGNTFCIPMVTMGDASHILLKLERDRDAKSAEPTTKKTKEEEPDV